MKKIQLIIFILTAILLTGCTELSVNYLVFELNPGVDTIEINEQYVDNGAYASYGFKEVVVTVIENTIDSTTIGEYEIVYQAVYKDLVQTLVRKVTVVDETPPQLTLKPGVDTIVLGDTWIDASVDVYDESNQDVTLLVIGEVQNEVGSYEIIYQATDASGNISRISRIVYVINP